jgi:hypothetical protein
MNIDQFILTTRATVRNWKRAGYCRAACDHTARKASEGWSRGLPRYEAFLRHRDRLRVQALVIEEVFGPDDFVVTTGPARG